MWDGGGVVAVNGFFLAALHGCLGAVRWYLGLRQDYRGLLDSFPSSFPSLVKVLHSYPVSLLTKF